MIYKLMLSPPVAFIIILVTAIIISDLLSRLSFRQKGEPTTSRKAYACGEDAMHHLVQPDYSRFFPFAFFFTILHVIALMVTTVPVETIESFAIAVIYILGAIVGLVILFRR